MDDFVDKLENVQKKRYAVLGMDYASNPDKLAKVRIALSRGANPKVFFDAKLVEGNSYVITSVHIDENLPPRNAKKAQWKQERGSYYGRPKKPKGT